MVQETGTVSGGDSSTAAATATEPALARIDEAVRALDDIAQRPLDEHPELYQQVHGRLQAELAEIDGS